MRGRKLLNCVWKHWRNKSKRGFITSIETIHKQYCYSSEWRLQRPYYVTAFFAITIALFCVFSKIVVRFPVRKIAHLSNPWTLCESPFIRVQHHLNTFTLAQVGQHDVCNTRCPQGNDLLLFIWTFRQQFSYSIYCFLLSTVMLDECKIKNWYMQALKSPWKLANSQSPAATVL